MGKLDRLTVSDEKSPLTQISKKPIIQQNKTLNKFTKTQSLKL